MDSKSKNMQKNVIEYLSETVGRFPEKTAVKDSEMSITFAELWQNAQKISSALINTNIGLRNPIGVYIPKGCKMIEAFAGINLSGNFYVPLDTKSPASRIESIISTLEAKVLITDRTHLSSLKTFCNVNIMVVEDIVEADVNIINAFAQLNSQIDTDPVYSIFTSGSTGVPKGVVVSHRGVIDYIDWANDTFHFKSDAVIGNQAPFYFDNSTLDIYLMYSTGATLNIIPESYFAFPAKLVDYLNEEQISFVFWVPFVLGKVANLNIFESKEPKYIKDVFFAGEVMPNKHLNYWRKHLPNCRYANLYGPTEITVDCTYYEVKREFRDDEPLPIGYVCKNSDILILVDRKRLVNKGEQGELCVRGSSLALGYYNDPERTAQAFIQNPLNNHYPETIYCTGDVVYENEYGEIMYVGRVDSQIKHNGYRIELGEIETALETVEGLGRSLCMYDEAKGKILAFYEGDLEKKQIVRAIGTRLPGFMIPNVFVKVEEFPLTKNGKIDRKKLEEAYESGNLTSLS